MSAFEESWGVLKGNPNARVQDSTSQPRELGNSGYSVRDFAIHPAALGAANRQVMAENANRKRLNAMAHQQGGKIPFDAMKNAARRMVTPEQRASLKNDSFDLKYKNPKFISRIKPPERSKEVKYRESADELRAEIQAQKDATARREKLGRDRRGRRLPTE